MRSAERTLPTPSGHRCVGAQGGEVKRRHGLGRCRYLGVVKYAVQSLLTALVVNLSALRTPLAEKRMVLLLYGVKLRGRAGGLVRA